MNLEVFYIREVLQKHRAIDIVIRVPYKKIRQFFDMMSGIFGAYFKI